MQTVLQIPVKKELRDQAVKAAMRHGFSSLQEAVRVFLNQFASNKVFMSFTSGERLSEQNEARYTRMIGDIVSGIVKTKQLPSARALIQYLQR